MKRAKNSSAKSMSGIGMIEILITVFILAIGLLGLAGLHLVGMRETQQSFFYYVAAQQAYDMADRMRANAQGVSSGAYNNISGTGSGASCKSATANCSVAQIAAYDAFVWNTNNANLLPAGQGTVAGAGSNSVFTITTSWTEMQAGGNPAVKNFVLKLRL